MTKINHYDGYSPDHDQHREEKPTFDTAIKRAKVRPHNQLSWSEWWDIWAIRFSWVAMIGLLIAAVVHYNIFGL